MPNKIDDARSSSVSESAKAPHNARTREKRRCGAKTRVGGECQAPTVNGNIRCRRHGGESTGAKSVEGQARIVEAVTRHGIYASAYSDDEISLLPAIRDSIGKLDDELTMMRMQFRRASIAQKRAFEKDDDGLEVVKFVDKAQTEFSAGPERTYERVNYSQILDRLAGRIESLERTRSELLDKAQERADAEKDDEPITEWTIHVVTAENVHLYRDQEADEVLAPDEPIPESPIL